MTLFIAILIIYGFGLPNWLYGLAVFLWLIKVICLYENKVKSTIEEIIYS